MLNCFRFSTKNLSSPHFFCKFKVKLKNVWNIVEHCKSQSRVPKPSLVTSVKVALGVSVAVSVRQWPYVICQANDPGLRLTGSVIRRKDPDFQWLMLWDLIKPYLKELLIAIAAALACAALSIHIPRALGDIINVVSEHIRESAQPFLEEIKGPAARLVALYGLLAASTFVYIHFLSTVGEGVALTMKTKLFSNLMRQDISFFDSNRTGELINRLTVDVNDFKTAFKMVVSQGLRNVAQLLGCTVTLLYISPQMTGLMVVGIPSIILLGTLIGSVLRKLSFEAKAQAARLTLIADEALSNIRTVRAFAMENLEGDMFTKQAERTRELNERLHIGIAGFQAATSLFMNGLVLSTLYLGGRLVSEQVINPGDLMAYLVALQILQRSFTQISLLFGTYIKGLQAGARVFEMMQLEPAVQINSGKMIPYHSLIPEVEFNGVTFAYPGRPQRNVLDNFSLKIPVGKTVAIVGTSGSGKSTVGWLVERFYDVDKGQILVGGEDIKSLNPSWLRGRVLGLISQEPVLFATSILENIRYGRPAASDLEVMEAAKLANADEFIRRFPEGYNTMVGERGVAVSGGQKQRIAIARALLKNPSVLILDEATSALDTESEHLVQAALEQVMEKRTTIVIAHRLSTIQNADLIIVMNNGTIIEQGTHKELMAKKGVYASFVEQQRLSGRG